MIVADVQVRAVISSSTLTAAADLKLQTIISNIR
jgi:hypothetical protein